MMQWDQVADVADSFSRVLGQANDKLLELGKLGAGARVLDIGSGTGALARRAASRVGPTGKVIGIDISATMVDAANTQNGAENCQFYVSDAHELRFADDICDAVFCQMGLPFFENPERVLTRAQAVLKPGGRLVLMTFGALEHNTFFTTPGILDEATQARIAAFSDTALLSRGLEGLGFVDVRARPIRALATVSNIEAYWSTLRGTLGIATPPPPDLVRRVPPGSQLSIEVVFALALKRDPVAEKSPPLQAFETIAAKARRQVRELSPIEVTRALGKQAVRYIDVREPDEWTQGTIKGAIRIPRGELEQRILREVPDRNSVIVTFDQDGSLGALAAARLHALGYSAVWNLYGGFSAWKSDGMAVEAVRA